MSSLRVSNIQSQNGSNGFTIDSSGTVDTSGNFRFKRWTTGTRPSGSIGMVGYNTEDEVTEIYTGTEWVPLGSGGEPDGSSAEKAALNPQAILAANPSAPSGVYWIDLPTVGPTQVYCEMSSSHLGGGGWMLAWKCTRGSTFHYNQSYWSSANTYNATSQLNRGDGDHKNHCFNYYSMSSVAAVFPDINNGGQSSVPYNGWTWLQGGQSGTCLSRFQQQQQLSGNPRGSSMWQGSGYSNQNGFQWYGFNYTQNGSNRVRWGFGWNNEGNQGSNDVSGGIGMQRDSYSCGDRIYCCQGTTGVNRNMRAEIWIR